MYTTANEIKYGLNIPQ